MTHPALTWLDAFAAAVRARDYVTAKTYFVENVVGFGTIVPTARGVHRLEEGQWRAVWDVTENFRFHAASVYEHETLAVAAAEWTSTRVADGTPRGGRATIVLRRTGDAWHAVHTHFSLTPTGQL